MSQYFLFHKIEDIYVIDHCDVFEASTFTINLRRRCQKELGETGVKCDDRRMVFEDMRGYLCKNCNGEIKNSHSPPKKRHIARDYPSCSYVPGGFWIVLNIADFDYWIVKLSKNKGFTRNKGI